MAELAERRVTVDGIELFLRTAEVAPGGLPTLYLHGNPTTSADWIEFLALTGGLAPDLPGWGRSAKPSHIDYSAAGLAPYIAGLIQAEGIDRFNLVIHDWGSLALAMDPAILARVQRLVIIDAVPLFGSYRWHWVGRLWRVPVVGELSMGFMTRGLFKRLTRFARVADGPMPDHFLDTIWDTFDQGTQRAILKLYRSADPDALAAAGAQLGAITCPALVIWGEQDPYVGPENAQLFADALGGPTEVELVDAGHWPWIERPELIERVTRFVNGAA